ncbi:MAG: HD domain-containing phosphohydrolase [Thermodesulfobacteriota bacterium]
MHDDTTILIIDDAPENIKVVSGLLKESYRLKVATSGEKGLLLAVEPPCPDLILLDVMMPGMDGYEVCRRLQEDSRTRMTPVIFLTARTEVADEAKGFALGAVDYIAKPISPPILLARVRTHLQLKEAQDILRRHNQMLEERVRQRTRQLNAVQDVAFQAMGSLAETRDSETGNHIRRTRHYVGVLAEYLRKQPKYIGVLTEEYVCLLVKSSPLHDIGKVGVPDRILLKPGPLTVEEFEEIKLHTTMGRDALLRAEEMLEESESFLSVAREIAYSHHERWDGAGYPLGLRGEEIPLAARLMAVADVYDSLRSMRVYKSAKGHEEAAAIIREGRGSHFDPDVVDAFLACEERFRSIAEQFKDE